MNSLVFSQSFFSNKQKLISKKIYDLSIGSTETKHRKPNTKIQNIFCCVNENMMTFLYTLKFDGGDKKTEGEKSFLFQSVYKSRMLLKKLGF